MDVKGSVVFVTGANRGLGLAFAREAVARGARKVYAGMRNTEGFSEPGVIAVKLDVTDPASVEAAAAACQDVTLLVNNAGIAGVVDHPLDSRIEAESQRLFDTNYLGVVRMTRAFAPALTKDGNSGIINVLSNASWVPIPFLTAYAVSKSAAWSFTNHARLHLKDQGVQVLGLHVGFIDTDLTKGLDIPKADPVDVVRQTYDGLKAGATEVMADEGTQNLKRSLSQDIPGYVDPSVI